MNRVEIDTMLLRQDIAELRDHAQVIWAEAGQVGGSEGDFIREDLDIICDNLVELADSMEYAQQKYERTEEMVSGIVEAIRI